jgi:hypothetical protein
MVFSFGFCETIPRRLDRPQRWANYLTSVGRMMYSNCTMSPLFSRTACKQDKRSRGLMG